MTASLAVTDQSVWPPRKLITITGLTNAFFTLFRVVGTQRTPVRGAHNQYVWPATDHLVVDAEMPFGLAYSYEIEQPDGTVVDTDGPHTVTLPGGLVALSDAITGLAAEVTIGAMDPLASTTNAAVYATDGLNRVVSSPLSQPTTIIEYLTTTLTARNDLRALLAGTTAGIYQQRGPDPAYDADAYYSVLESRERRFSQDGTDERRITAVTVAQVDPWHSSLAAVGYDYADLAGAYTGLTYVDLNADFATYLDLAQGDFG